MNEEFEFRKDEDGYEIDCSDCGSSNVKTTAYYDLAGKIEYLCIFCYSTVGKMSDPIDKMTFMQALNVLLKEITK